MGTKVVRKRFVYGVGDDLLELPPSPIISDRAPTTSDRAEYGTMWIDKSSDSAYTLTTITANLSNWEPLGGALTLEHINGNSGQATPAAGIITLTGTQGEIFTGSGATVTASFQRLELGTSAARFTATSSGFSTADGNALQSYVSTSGGTAGTSYKAIRGDLLVVSGDGTESPQAVRGSITCSTDTDVEEAYAGFFLATQNDGTTNIDSNMIGCLGMSLIEEATAADQPQQWIAGTQSIVSFDAAAAVPTATIVCANLNHVTYDAAMDGVAHGVVVSRNGGGAGSSAGSAFKVVNGGAVDDWTYGLDLYNDSAQDYATADVRLWNQATIVSAAAGVSLNAVAGDDWTVKMGDNAAANKVSFTDSDDAEVASLDSDGNLAVDETVTAGTGITATTGDIDATAGAITAGTSVSATTTVTGGTGVSATTGDITADAGDVVATLGAGNFATTVTAGTGITATTGDIDATAGAVTAGTSVSATTTVTGGTGVSATTGDITADAGDLVATLGAGNVATTLTAGTGITATTGDIAASSGNVSASGTVTGGTGVTATTGDVASSAGNVTAALDVVATEDVKGRSIFATGDEGTGEASTTALTNVVDTTLSSGAGVVLMKTANPGNSAGWIKIYVGTDVRYIPFWSDISP